MENIARAQPPHLHQHRAGPGDDAAVPVHPLVSDQRQAVHGPAVPVFYARRLPVHFAGTVGDQVT